MRASLSPSHSGRQSIRWHHAPHLTAANRQVLLDKLTVFAVGLLVLAMLAMSVLYVAHELPRWRDGQIGGFEATPALTAPADTPASTGVTAVQAPTIGRTPLMLISMAIEVAIFVGLGLYLRHEADQLP